MTNRDVVIVGGAVVGSAVAYFLAADPAFRARVLVVEKDPSYADCATSRSVGGIRQQFSTPANVRLSRYGLKLMREQFSDRFGAGASASFHERGYLLLAGEEGRAIAQANLAVQRAERLGLTATLIREDGRESDVFTLIGPKKYDVPWRELESRGWIAEAACTEVRLPLPEPLRMEYAVAEWRDKFRVASENPGKDEIVARLLARYRTSKVLIIGQYLRQLRQLHRRFDIPLITGQTPSAERESLYNRFRQGEVRRLILSKVGNFALDLPDANVLIQVSGTFGSRQEEAQRLGRILRPKADGEAAHFFTLVTRDTREIDFAHHRQLFLTEQGYSYAIVDSAEVLEPGHKLA